jgi:hypothetical protein
MSTIINIRNASGAGKTTLVNAFVARYESVEPIGKPTNPEALELTDSWLPPLHVLVSADRAPNQDWVCNKVRQYADAGDLIFEGLMISTLFSRYRDLAREMTAAGHRFVFAYLDTPLDVCLARVAQRRAARGSKPKDDRPRAAPTYRDVARCNGKLRAAGLDVRTLDYKSPFLVDELLSWLHEESMTRDLHDTNARHELMA